MIPIITEITNEDTIVIYEMGKPRSAKIWTMGLREEFDYRTAETLNACIDNTNRSISKLEADIEAGLRDKGTGKLLVPLRESSFEVPKAFISHGTESAALNKLEDFLHNLGIIPLIVKEQPSLGKTISDKVEYYLQQSDFVIILATGDDEFDGKLHPRQNVIHEIGLAQKTHPNRIIYLLEEKVEFPSNIAPRVWERFKQRNMLGAFLCILRELRALGILLAIKPQQKERV
jgi:hypothetical protein